jgi:hypothetical protein
MAKGFKERAAQLRNEERTAVPQVDPERPLDQAGEVAPVAPAQADRADQQVAPAKAVPVGPKIAPVDTSEQVVSASFSMYPSRKEQMRDLSYIERRRPWEIMEDAIEEYVVRHYGKEHRRR